MTIFQVMNGNSKGLATLLPHVDELPAHLLVVGADRMDGRRIGEMAVDSGMPTGGVTCAGTVDKARRALTEQPPDCIIVDLSHPAGAGPRAVGPEAVAAMAAAAPAVPIVVLTDDLSDAAAALAEGAGECLTTPDLDVPHLRDVLLRASKRRVAAIDRLRMIGTSSGILDSIDAPTVALDGAGRIVGANWAWRSSHPGDGMGETSTGLGGNYLEACDSATGSFSEGSEEVASGIRNVLSGEVSSFALDYRALSSGTERWFTVRVFPIGELGGGVLVTHLDITHLKLGEMSLCQGGALLEAVFDESAPICALYGADGVLRQVSEAATALFGLHDHENLGERILANAEPADLDAARTALKRVLRRPGQSEQFQIRVRDVLGRWRVVDLALTNRLDDPEVAAVVIAGSDVTDGRLNQIAHRLESRLLQSLPTAVSVVDDRYVVVYWNERAAALFGIGPDAAIGRNLASLGLIDERDHEPERMASMRNTGRWEGEVELTPPDGSANVPAHMSVERIDVDDIGFRGFVVTASDIRKRLELERSLAFEALHDPVTGLPNRRRFVQHLEGALSESAVTGQRTAVLFIDLDDFKLINDRLGYLAGDHVLRKVGSIIREALRSKDMVARLTGDDFVVCCNEVHGRDEAYVVAKRIIDALTERSRVDDEVTVATASVGIALSGPDSCAEGLMRNAAMAMYAAKQGGKARIELFDDALQAIVRGRHELANELENALDLGQIETYFQPQIALVTGELVGFEALARWNHPERGLVPPTDFIPLAEDVGLIGRLGQEVLRHSCLAMQEWRRTAPGRHFEVAVNVSARQLSDPAFPTIVQESLQETGTPPLALCLELTESMLVDDEVAASALFVLKDIGTQIAIDDFGTGYSSLSRLHRFPIDYLKIDRTFVSGMVDRAEDAVIVSCVLALARGLGLRTIAEGIEEEAQLELLAAAGCNFGQGWLWSPAVPAVEALELVQATHPFRGAGARTSLPEGAVTGP